MTTPIRILETPRLVLRTWQEKDLEPMVAINNDRRVMKYFPALQGSEVTLQFMRRMNRHHQENGYAIYALELCDTGEMIGFTGLQKVNFKAPFTPAIEIGWRLAVNVWRQGYATEAASAVLDYGLTAQNLKEIVAFTVPDNVASWRIMEKIGMRRCQNESFYHPKFPPDHPLSYHILYRIRKNGDKIFR